MADVEAIAAYRTAWDRWRSDLEQVHAVLLDGASLDPLHRVALLRRESHSKERYEAARARLFGLPGGGADAENAFPPEE